MRCCRCCAARHRELRQKPARASAVGDTLRTAGAIAIAWLIGLPRRLGNQLFALNDAEAGWRGWQVTELKGLVRPPVPRRSIHRSAGAGEGTVTVHGLPRRPGEPSVLSSVESAIREVRGPGPVEFCWNWRSELSTVAVTTGLCAFIAVSLGVVWLAAAAGAGLAAVGAMLRWPPARARLTARSWCVITPHRILGLVAPTHGCRQAAAGCRSSSTPCQPATASGPNYGAWPASQRPTCSRCAMC